MPNPMSPGPSPWSLAGALAALRALAPGDSKVELFTGLAGAAVGAGLGVASQQSTISELEAALQKERTLRQTAELRAQAWASIQRHNAHMQQLQALLNTTAQLTSFTPPTYPPLPAPK